MDDPRPSDSGPSVWLNFLFPRHVCPASLTAAEVPPMSSPPSFWLRNSSPRPGNTRLQVVLALMRPRQGRESQAVVSTWLPMPTTRPLPSRMRARFM
jgi:hypothetical protein